MRSWAGTQIRERLPAAQAASLWLVAPFRLRGPTREAALAELEWGGEVR